MKTQDNEKGHISILNQVDGFEIYKKQNENGTNKSEELVVSIL